MSLKEVADAVRNNKRFLITTHTSPEGDAVGSELAIECLLKLLGKEAVIVNQDEAPYGYEFLPGIKNIKKFKDGLALRFDCLIILDCSDLLRCGRVAELNLWNKPVINIDHHISNRLFGQVNWVMPYCSSTAEMVYHLYKKMRLAPDAAAALSLYVGIMTDTGSFQYSNTCASTHRIAAQLLKYKLNVAQIYRNIYGNIPFGDMKLLTRILPHMKREAGGKIIWFQVKQPLLRHKTVSFDLTENLLSFARSVKDVEVVVLFKENLGIKDQIRVNLRSHGRVDVNKIANFFGGGGHRTASGATVRGSIERVRRQVLSKIRAAL